MPFIIGRKIEMSQVFKEDGAVVPVTLVRVEPNVVTRVLAVETDGSSSVELGTEATHKPLNKPEAGQLKDLPMLRTRRAFRVGKTELKRGDSVTVADFAPGMKVDVVGVSKGKGFAGVVKRHHFRGQNTTHGTKDQVRMPGSLASQRQGPPVPGQRMGGHMGDARVTVKNLEVVAIDAQKNTLAIKGAVPGARNGLLLIQSRESKTLWQK
jgi:large subunit ribosomal protein L3